MTSGLRSLSLQVPYMQSRRVTQILIIFILILAIVTRFYNIDAHSMWNDEGNSARIAERSIDLILEGAAGDIHPPLYYLTLHVWRGVFGASEAALRALSSVFGVITVLMTFLLGRRLFDARVALLAATIAALNPFQIFYSQEARMYMMLAAIGVVSTYLLVRLLDFWSLKPRIYFVHRRYYVFYVSALAAGLYTHYAFPFIIVVHFAVVAAWSLYRSGRALAHMANWFALALSAAVLFLPWLPTALRQISNWSSQAALSNTAEALHESLKLYVLGPTAHEGETLVPILVATFFLIMSMWTPDSFDEPEPDWHTTFPRVLRIGTVLMYWLLPMALIFSLGLFTEAYFKFLLVGSPAFCLLLARGIDNGWQIARGAMSMPRELSGQREWAFSWVLVVLFLVWLIVVPTARSLHALYFDPDQTRDNYRDIAIYIDNHERDGDVVLLHAANQWEVFTYYYSDAPNVIPIVTQRPLDPVEAEGTLNDILASYRRLYVLYWGETEPDPHHIVETWLDAHTFKATEVRYGNVRLVRYAVPEEMDDEPQTRVNVRLGENIYLDGYSLLTPRVAAGDIVQLALFWHADELIENRYKVFVHIYNEAGSIVAQTDREPGGDRVPTNIWSVGETIVDRYGVLLPDKIEAAEYQISIGMYFLGDNYSRLPINDAGVDIGDAFELANISVGP